MIRTNRMAARLAAAFMMIVLLASLVIGIFFINVFRDYSFESKRSAMTVLANDMADIAGEYGLSSLEPEDIPGFADLLDTVSNVQIWIADKDGGISVLSSRRHGQMGANRMMTAEARQIIEQILNGVTVNSDRDNTFYNEAMIMVGVPVYDGAGSIVGAILLHAPVTGVTEMVDMTFGILLKAMLLAAVLAAAMGVLFSRRFTRPLKIMNEAALQMAGGNYEIRTNITRKDEIGELSASIDFLADKLGLAVDQLYQEKSKLKDVIDSMSDGLLAYDVDLKLIDYNEKAKELLGNIDGVPDESALGSSPETADLLERLRMSVVSGEASALSIVRGEKTLLVSVTPIRNNQDRIAGAAALIRDVSESERLEQMRKDFIANVSHEFRTPLTLIKGSAEAIADGTAVGRDQIAAYYKRIIDETLALERLVSDLLDLSQIEAGKMALNIELLDMAQLLADTAKGMQLIADKKNIMINCRINNELPPVPGDHGRLRQTLVIFLDNAIKYSRGDMTIEIEAFGSEERVAIRIKDHGPGISEEDLPLIWERYYRRQASPKREAQAKPGAGLGLAIAKHIIEMHKGTVSLKSVAGEGTTVEIDLPAGDGAAGRQMMQGGGDR